MSTGRTVNSQSQEWCTPPKYVKAVKEMFDGIIELDPCSNSESIVCAETEFILPQKDGLKEIWEFESQPVTVKTKNMEKKMELVELVEETLKMYNADGLCNNIMQCGCLIGDLMPCSEPSIDCEMGYIVKLGDGTEEQNEFMTKEGLDWIVCPFRENCETTKTAVKTKNMWKAYNKIKDIIVDR